jgi:hypothetical protein
MATKNRKSVQATIEYPGHVLEPLEVADFVQSPIFTKEWQRLRLTDDDLRILEIIIMTGPSSNPRMVGTGGLRKIRFSPPGWPKGQGGALRACYVYFKKYRMILLVIVYKKGEFDDLSPAGRKAAKEIIMRQKKELDKRTIR